MFKIDSGIIILAFVINDLGLGFLLGKKSFKQYPFYIITQKSLALIFAAGAGLSIVIFPDPFALFKA